MRRNYFLLSVFPVSREMARTYIMVNMNGKNANRVLERYTVFSRFRKDKKQRDTVLLTNERDGTDFILISNTTAVTSAKQLKLQFNYFFNKEEEIIQTVRDRDNWKTLFIANYSDGEPLNVVKLHYRGQLDLSKEDIKAMMELYFDGKLDKIETFDVLPDDLAEYRLIEFYLIETHEEKSLKGVSTTRYFLLLIP